MIIAELLDTVLGAACGNKFFPGEAPPKPSSPYAVYNYFGNVNNTTRGSTNFQNQRVQIDVYATTQLAAEALAATVETLMAAQDAYSSPTRYSSMQLSHSYIGVDPTTKHHRVLLEFSVWYVKV